MVLTLASLVCLVIVGLGGRNKSSTALSSLYFFRANTSHITANASMLGLPSDVSNTELNSYINNATHGSLLGGTTNVSLSDYYTVSLWNYCSGNFTGSGHNDTNTPSFCSPQQSQFWFNPVAVWGLTNTSAENVFGKQLNDGLNTYHTVAKWMFIAYVIAIISTAVEILAGIFAIFSRLGSLLTSIVSFISGLFIGAFAITVTILYSTLMGTFNTALNKYNIHGDLGRSMFIFVWLAVLFSWLSGIFWLFSSCCCSGRSNKIRGYEDGYNSGFKKGANYERVGSPIRGAPYGQPQGAVPMGPVRGTAYEPYRHDRA